MKRTMRPAAVTRAAGVALLVATAMIASGCGQVSDALGLSTKAAVKKTPARAAVVEPKDAPVEKAEAPEAPRAAAAAPRTKAPAPARRAAPGSTTETQALPSSSPAPAPTEAPTLIATAQPAPPAPVEEPLPDAVVHARPVVDEASPIYTVDDADVTPARLLTKPTGGPVLRNVRSDVNTMELVISKQGRVEQVKLMSPTKRMTDMLLLSGAKTWKFQPALKDGAPVRYRTHYSWEALP